MIRNRSRVNYLPMRFWGRPKGSESVSEGFLGEVSAISPRLILCRHGRGLLAGPSREPTHRHEQEDVLATLGPLADAAEFPWPTHDVLLSELSSRLCGHGEEKSRARGSLRSNYLGEGKPYEHAAAVDDRRSCITALTRPSPTQPACFRAPHNTAFCGPASGQPRGFGHRRRQQSRSGRFQDRLDG